MKKLLTSLALCITLMLLTTSCGYRNPNIYSGPAQNIYITNWKNRTNELQLNSELYRALRQWFQKSRSFSIVTSKEQGNLILAGEILSIDLPTLSYAAGTTTSEVDILLTVRYVLKDLENNEILFEVPSEVRTEEFSISSDSASSSDNEEEALDTIMDDLAQDIYQKTIAQLSRRE